MPPLPTADLPWLQPYPDRLLEGIAPTDAEPDAAVVSKETIELAFLVAIQHLTPRQRAVLILRDVLDWPAKDTAVLLDASVDSVHSMLRRARSTLKRHLPAHRLEWASDSDPTQEERSLLRRYMDAHDRADGAALATLLQADARLTMPPTPTWYDGREAVVAFHAQLFIARYGMAVPGHQGEPAARRGRLHPPARGTGVSRPGNRRAAGRRRARRSDRRVPPPAAVLSVRPPASDVTGRQPRPRTAHISGQAAFGSFHLQVVVVASGRGRSCNDAASHMLHNPGREPAVLIAVSRRHPGPCQDDFVVASERVL